ncbi:MAG: uroporphyrinogen-III synthase, partial [Kangiellaceae bacterium]|nr:uroporphyrinogen-III synthase [Kangiellaceae bacterium]
VIVKGEAGRPLLQQELTQKGAKVTTLDVYQRKIPNWALQKNIAHQLSTNNIWLVTSAQAIDHLYRIQGLSEHPNHRTKLIVSSNRLAEFANKKGFTIFGQSSGASDLQLVQCVKSLFNH